MISAPAWTPNAALLEINDDVRGLAKVLVRERAMPGPEDAGDAIHLAAATVHRADFLLTWNQKHLANKNKVPHLREVCRRAGYLPPGTDDARGALGARAGITMSNQDNTRDWIDEVRSIRRQIVAEHGNDIDRLCDSFEQVEREYRARLERIGHR